MGLVRSYQLFSSWWAEQNWNKENTPMSDDKEWKILELFDNKGNSLGIVSEREDPAGFFGAIVRHNLADVMEAMEVIDDH